MSDCPWDRGNWAALTQNGPPPPPIRRRSHDTPEERRERERRREREKRFDPERPPERYARPHHFAVNPDEPHPLWPDLKMQFETWLRAVNVMVLEEFDEEMEYIDIDERLLLDPLLGQPEWAAGMPPSACVAYNEGLTPEQYFDWLMTSVRIQDDRSEWEDED